MDWDDDEETEQPTGMSSLGSRTTGFGREGLACSEGQDTEGDEGEGGRMRRSQDRCYGRKSGGYVEGSGRVAGPRREATGSDVGRERWRDKEAAKAEARGERHLLDQYGSRDLAARALSVRDQDLRLAAAGLLAAGDPVDDDADDGASSVPPPRVGDLVELARRCAGPASASQADAGLLPTHHLDKSAANIRDPASSTPTAHEGCGEGNAEPDSGNLDVGSAAAAMGDGCHGQVGSAAADSRGIGTGVRLVRDCLACVVWLDRRQRRLLLQGIRGPPRSTPYHSATVCFQPHIPSPQAAHDTHAATACGSTGWVGGRGAVLSRGGLQAAAAALAAKPGHSGVQRAAAATLAIMMSGTGAAAAAATERGRQAGLANTLVRIARECQQDAAASEAVAVAVAALAAGSPAARVAMVAAGATAVMQQIEQNANVAAAAAVGTVGLGEGLSSLASGGNEWWELMGSESDEDTGVESKSGLDDAGTSRRRISNRGDKTERVSLPSIAGIAHGMSEARDAGVANGAEAVWSCNSRSEGLTAPQTGPVDASEPGVSDGPQVLPKSDQLAACETDKGTLCVQSGQGGGELADRMWSLSEALAVAAATAAAVTALGKKPLDEDEWAADKGQLCACCGASLLGEGQRRLKLLKMCRQAGHRICFSCSRDSPKVLTEPCAICSLSLGSGISTDREIGHRRGIKAVKAPRRKTQAFVIKSEESEKKAIIQDLSE